MREDKPRSRMEQRRNPAMHRLLLPADPSASAGAAPSSALGCSAVSAVASSTRRAWSSNQQTCASTGETRDTADEEAGAGLSRPTSSRLRPQRPPRCRLSQPASQLPQRRQPHPARLLPPAALTDNRAEPQVGHGQPPLQPARRPAPTQRRRRTTRPSRLSATVVPRRAEARWPPRLKPRPQPQQQPPVPRRSAALLMHSCKRRCIRRSKAQRRQRQPQLGLPRPSSLPPSRPRHLDHGQTRVMEATQRSRRC